MEKFRKYNVPKGFLIIKIRNLCQKLLFIFNQFTFFNILLTLNCLFQESQPVQNTATESTA